MAQLFYDTKLSLAIASNQELSLTLGARTIVYLTAGVGASFTLWGIAQVGGNIDGAVVTLANVSNNNSQLTYAHDSSSASSVVNRFWNAGEAGVMPGVGIGAGTYRYDGTIQRWIMISRT